MNRLALALFLSSALLYYYLGLLVPVPPAAYATRLVLDENGTAVQRYTFIGEPASHLDVELEAQGAIKLYPPAATRALEYSIDGSPPRHVEGPHPIEAAANHMEVRTLLDPKAEPGTFSLEVDKPLKLAVLEVQLPQLRYRVAPKGYGIRHGYVQGQGGVLPVITAYRQMEGTAFIGIEIEAERVPFLLFQYAALTLALGALLWVMRSVWRG